MPPAIPGATLTELERFAILAALAHCGGRQREAARLLGISPRTLQNRVRRYTGAGPSTRWHS